jgi:hypothetical protein
VALVVFTPLLPLPAQAALLLLLFAIFSFVHKMMSPFKDAWMNTLEFSVLVTTLVNISGVLLITGGAAGDDGSNESLLLGLAILALNLALVTCIICSAFATHLGHVRYLQSKKWTALVFFGERLLERCRSGCKCFSRGLRHSSGSH